MKDRRQGDEDQSDGAFQRADLGGHSLWTKGVMERIVRKLEELFPKESETSPLFTMPTLRILPNGERYRYIGLDHYRNAEPDGSQKKGTSIFFSRGREINSLCKFECSVTIVDDEIIRIRETETIQKGIAVFEPHDGERYERAVQRVLDLLDQIEGLVPELMHVNDPLLSVSAGISLGPSY